MGKIFYQDKDIESARQMDLLTYLKLYEPENLVKVHGDTYCTRQHDSLKISNGKWMWWSRGFGGYTALDYLVKVEGYSFTQAMEKLCGLKVTRPSFFMPKMCEQKPKKLLLPAKNDNNNAVIQYLLTRGIDREIINTLIEMELLYESSPHANCIFIGKDKEGTPRYAAYRTCTSKRLLGDASGSDKSYPFRIENSASPNLHIFESAIDLLSFASLKKMKGLSWNDENLLSMGGIAVSKTGSIPIAIKRFLEENMHIKEIHIHFDNDPPGISAAKVLQDTLSDSYEVFNSPPPFGKDFNDYLLIRISKTY